MKRGCRADDAQVLLVTTSPPSSDPVATLVMLRHGSSLANEDGRFGGWEVVGLSAMGVEQARAAGRQLKRLHLHFHLGATSVLRRAIWTLWHCLDAMDQPWTPSFCDWRLNERHYGGLQGMNRAQATQRYGEEQVRLWRRGFRQRPPLLEPGDARDSFGAVPYQALQREQVPLGESLQDTQQRALACWDERILPALARHENVLLVAHGNSIRSLLMSLENISEDRISQLEIENALPLIYELRRDGSFLRRAIA